jgi:hypothetical protein
MRTIHTRLCGIGINMRSTHTMASKDALHAPLRPDHKLACHLLAIEVFRTYDQQLLNPKSSPATRIKAMRRLQAALPNLTAFLDNHLLEFEDRAYVNELRQRLIGTQAS